MRSRLSHASHLLLYGEESRAAKVTILVVLSIAFCWMPFCSVTFYSLFNQNQRPMWTFNLALMCSLCNTIFSPILYAFRSKRVQRDAKKVLPVCNSKANKGRRSRNLRHFQRNKDEKIKVQRQKSMSCPQLLISSVNDNDNTIATRTFITTLTTENEPIFVKNKRQKDALFASPNSLR